MGSTGRKRTLSKAGLTCGLCPGKRGYAWGKGGQKEGLALLEHLDLRGLGELEERETRNVGINLVRTCRAKAQRREHTKGKAE